MAVDYQGYARYMGARNPIAENADKIGATLSDLQQQRIQQEGAARRNTLADLQIQQGRSAMEDTQARQGAMQGVYGASSLQDAYTRQMQAEQAEKQKVAKQKGMEVYLNTVKALDGMPNLDPKSKTDIAKHFLSQNPEYAPMADNLTFVDSKGVKASRQFAEGELKDPVSGQPLPAGYYETEGVWTGDATNPVKLTNYKLVKEKPDAEALLDKRLAAQSASQDKTIAAADRRMFAQINAMDRRANQKANGPGKALPAGQLESIADMKQVAGALQEAKDLLSTGKVTTGPVSGRLQSLGAKVGAASDDFVNFQQKAQTAQNIMLKLRSGAAVTESEYSRFLKEFPTPNDSPSTRDRKIDNVINYFNNLMEEKMNVYEEGGYKVPRKTAQPKIGKTSATSGSPTKQSGRFTVTEVP